MKTVKLYIVISLASSLAAYCQQISNITIASLPDQYIEINYSKNSRIWVKTAEDKTVFFGQDGKYLVENEKIVYFQNYLELLNYMYQLGYEFAHNYSSAEGSNNIFLLKRSSL
jgi:hypothetical protein